MAGCTVSVGGRVGAPAEIAPDVPHVPRAGLEKSIKEDLSAKAGVELKSVTCDGLLKGTVGATQRCVATGADGVSYGITVRTKSVTGTHVKFDITVDDEPIK
ncbi:DUF4333 domain-containing protein [Mycobacterium sp. CBMA247]|nr:DUF4333 domain-containing protein [Mycolicibacterium sp. CBMA 329]MUL90818.1 DUF4333 domain-containing protein [Mycolicibacterium sp. CBMA 331]MUM01766.1 DUF4333 domain-containing protein [Mycolicibacterium sp. CBMA 334]MUM26630.1 DUF4333 domain-containing protein [Mycolicibacterium sp. CBMA 295]MUM40577.1 DUF4333 domain-containing protein [Mycolicibacterium sp. CBMA 247]MUM46773.1 DUF4333 domain-containing protein [Mycolicibacterium sp. CBMA 294]